MRRIGKYEVLGLLGRGGMGAVYKVRHPVTGAILALKLLSPNPFLLAFHTRRELARQFRTEAAVLGALGHENLARVWDFAGSRRGPYFLMEYCCLDLGRVIGESGRVEEPTRALPLPRAVSCVRQALAGLARLHHAGVVHRDIKPANLLVTAEGRVKITDLGLSRVRGEALPARPGLKVGSPYYAAPEQERDPDRAGPAADLYAMGATLHRLLLGVLPGDGVSPPSRLSPDLDRDWDAFFARVLHPDPAGRPASAREMDRQLGELHAAWKLRVEQACRMGEPGPVPETGPAPAVRRGPLRREPRKVAGRAAREAFGLDALWRPVPWPAPRFSASGETVLDGATGLVWQRGGSDYPLDWDEARRHVRALAEAGFAGRADWRLPTVEEAVSMLTPPLELAGYCLDAVFDPAVRLMWTADRRTFTQAWFADAEQGAVCFADRTCPLGARAVAGP